MSKKYIGHSNDLKFQLIVEPITKKQNGKCNKSINKKILEIQIQLFKYLFYYRFNQLTKDS